MTLTMSLLALSALPQAVGQAAGPPSLFDEAVVREVRHARGVVELGTSGKQARRVVKVALDPADARPQTLRVVSGAAELRWLGLSSPGFADEEFKHVAGMKRLRVLLIPHCTRMSGEGLAVLGHLKELEELDASHTSFGDTAAAALTGCPRLHTLNLWNTKTTDAALGHIAKLPALRKLSFKGAKRRIGSGALLKLRAAPALKEVNLIGTRIDIAGARAVAGIPRLEEVALSNTQFTDAHGEAFVGCKQLKVFAAEGNPDLTDGTARTLSKLTTLEEVGLSGSKVGDDGLALLGKLPRLRVLWVADTRVSGEGLKHLAKSAGLEGLHLQGLKIGDADLEALRPLKRLKSISLGRTNVTPKGIEALKKMLPQLNDVDFR
jgi:Leucine-rich repeat (LRR) protein